MAAAILWEPGTFGSYCWKARMHIKFPVGGGGGSFWGRGVEPWKYQIFFFMGVGIFL